MLYSLRYLTRIRLVIKGTCLIYWITRYSPSASPSQVLKRSYGCSGIGIVCTLSSGGCLIDLCENMRNLHLRGSL